MAWTCSNGSLLPPCPFRKGPSFSRHPCLRTKYLSEEEVSIACQEKEEKEFSSEFSVGGKKRTCPPSSRNERTRTAVVSVGSGAAQMRREVLERLRVSSFSESIRICLTS